MIELFGESDEISSFDEMRKKLKTITKSNAKAPVQLQIAYKKTIANFEVKLKNHKELLLGKIKVIELKSVKENLCSSLAPTDHGNIESYDLLKRHLRYMDNLKWEFRF